MLLIPEGLLDEVLPLSPNYSGTTSDIVSSPRTPNFLIHSLDEVPIIMTSFGQQNVHRIQSTIDQEQDFNNGLFDAKDINTWLKTNPPITSESTRTLML